MSLGPGTRLGPYEILSAIGAGGMGEVYRARDTRLDRIVAVKVLPSHVSNDSTTRERFEREARTVAALNHPHICTLYDVGSEAGTDFLIMEHLDGATLAARLEKGPLPLEEAVASGIQIADALDKAHRAGIIHRDLKPANIMLVRRGGPSGLPDVKLLDFGLAKITPAAVAPSGLSIAPTGVTPVTMQGTILGTLQYMAPEQLEGQEADARTDIFAFGCVLYEMLTGTRAFEGKTQASLIASILDRQPPAISALQPLTPPLAERIVSKCLAKNPDERWQSARDLLDMLTWLTDAESLVTRSPAKPTSGKWRRAAIWSVAALLVLAAGLVIGAVTRSPGTTAATPVTRFSIPPPNGTTFAGTGVPPFSISPDGTRVVFTANGEGGVRLWERRLDTLDAKALQGTEGVSLTSNPFWSPDSRFVGFAQAGRLKIVDVNGGSPQTVVAPALLGFYSGATWNREGIIVASNGAGLFRVSAEGGDLVPLPRADSSRMEQRRYPSFLPDGRHFLYTNVSASAPGVYVGSIDSPDSTRLLDTVSRAEYVPPGHLLYVRDGTLLARPFDANTLRFTGENVPVAEGIVSGVIGGERAFSVSQTGVVAWRAGLTGNTQLTWMDRAGRQVGFLGAEGEYLNPQLSPDGARAAVERVTSGNRDVWLLEGERGVASRFTFDAAPDFEPVWSPDGKSVFFMSPRPAAGLYQKTTGGGGDDQLVAMLKDAMAMFDVSRDGNFLVYQVLSPIDIWVLPLVGEHKPFPFLETLAFNESHAQVSPDGRWLAYVSNESGGDEIYVQRFPMRGAKQQVSANGGVQPRWSRNGKELFYLGLDQKLMAVPLSGQDVLSFGAPVPLFVAPVFGGNARAPMFRQQYDVSANGQRFLLNVPVTKGADTQAITVLVNWASRLKN